MTTYVSAPIETNSDDLSAEALDYLSANIPNFVARDGHLEVWLIQALARIIAEGRDVASNVPTSIFRYFGKSLVGLLPIDAVVATTTTTWTAIDDLGYTIPAGTHVGFQTTGNTIVAFVTTADAVIPAGETTVAGVLVQATDAGLAGNGLGPGAMVIIDSLSFLSSVSADAATTNGVDAESDDVYLSRLVDELKLLTPRPILPADFATLSRQISGVQRAVAIDNYAPTRTVSGDTTNGSAVITSESGTYNNWEVGRGISGDGIPDGTTILSIDADNQITMSANATADGAGVALTLVEMTDQERMVAVAVVDADGAALSDEIKAAVQAYLNSQREVNFVVNVFDPTYTSIDVDFTAVAEPNANTATVHDAAVQAVEDFLSPKNWGVNYGDDTGTTWTNESVVRYNALIGTLMKVDGLRWVTDLTIGGGAVDINLPGEISLPEPGAVTGTVTSS